jgi:hypothetical protein
VIRREGNQTAGCRTLGDSPEALEVRDGDLHGESPA